MSQKGHHPNIGSIIKIRDKIGQQLHGEKDPVSALHLMLNLIAIIEEKDRDLNLEKEIYDEIQYYYKTKSIHRKNMRQNRRYNDYNIWFKELNNTLYQGEYLLNKKYDSSGLKEFNEAEFEPA